MQKIVSVQVIKNMLPVIKSKFNTKLERKIKKLVKQHEESKSFFKKEIDMKQIRREAMNEGICGLCYDQSFISDLEIAVKNVGDVILESSELSLLYSLYEEEL